MYQHLSTDLARARMDQRLHEAEAFRRARETRGVQAAERRATLRKIAAATAHILVWPIRH
jgi:hypothetical protein